MRLCSRKMDLMDLMGLKGERQVERELILEDRQADKVPILQEERAPMRVEKVLPRDRERIPTKRITMKTRTIRTMKITKTIKITKIMRITKMTMIKITRMMTVHQVTLLTPTTKEMDKILQQ